MKCSEPDLTWWTLSKQCMPARRDGLCRECEETMVIDYDNIFTAQWDGREYTLERSATAGAFAIRKKEFEEKRPIATAADLGGGAPDLVTAADFATAAALESTGKNFGAIYELNRLKKSIRLSNIVCAYTEIYLVMDARNDAYCKTAYMLQFS
ncbi:unnamed protein product [Gongylonema pulchrum]|uniref:ShKT domain-containing protein n=1 Tax=Gongylonema pulchrum TaxID=637853 RepID=A0A183EMN8_9BILA|nr:unnamed protein product [Gongylonema pulchrum]